MTLTKRFSQQKNGVRNPNPPRPGFAVAKNCGGERVFLTDHMKNLWNEIGFIPHNFELDENDKSENDIQQAAKDAPVISLKSFPPMKKAEPNERDVLNYDGLTICIRNFPNRLEDKDIGQFLIPYGMPKDHDPENITVNKGKSNMWVVINGLNSDIVQKMFDSIHFHKSKAVFFGVPLYCKVLRNLTPVKKADKSEETKIPEAETINEKDAATTIGKDVNQKKKTDELAKQQIPGLPEEERLKSEKKKKKPKKKATNLKPIEKMSQQDFLLSKSSVTSNVLEEYEFSEYENDNDDEDSDDTEEAFEDSKESLSETENPQATANDFLTPFSLKSTFARTLQATTTSTPTSSSSVKRSASSPAEVKEKNKKKSRSQSQSRIPRKK